MGRFYSYRLQTLYALKSQPQTVLIIGKGDNIVGNILVNYGVNVINLDIEKALFPDLTGTVVKLPIKSKSFDVCICCQVLEHLPFKQFMTSLEELNRITKGYLVLSLPDIRRFVLLRIQLERFKFDLQLNFPRLSPLQKPFSILEKEGHYWEIGYDHESLNKIKREIRKSGWKILDIQRVKDYIYHTFFYCKV